VRAHGAGCLGLIHAFCRRAGAACNRHEETIKSFEWAPEGSRRAVQLVIAHLDYKFYYNYAVSLRVLCALSKATGIVQKCK
jgi:hypothetical protein